MRPLVRRLCLALLLAGMLCALPGCFGLSQNPSYFPYLLPTGDIVRTHAKPGGLGYYADFDPLAVQLELRPLQTATNPVGTQHVLIATVLDAKNQPRRSRRVEWMVEGVGNILEVDESGCLQGRGYKVDNKYAVSYTDYCDHQITRGNKNPNDDFVIRPGQTWCVVSAAGEGDTFVTAYAPGIFDWQRRKVTVNLRWVDASWVFPPPAVLSAGGEHLLTTRVLRHTGQEPLANYRVRYKLLAGPEAVFPQGGGPEVVVVSDLNGNATARLAQLIPRPGVNRIGVEIIRPPDPTAPSGVGVVLATGETAVEWVAPAIGLVHSGPPTVAVGQEATYQIAVSNAGKVESRSMTLTNPVPEGLEYVRSDPPAVVNAGNLIWTLGKLPPGQTHAVQATFRAVKLGLVQNCARVVTEEGQKDEKCVATTVGQAALKVDITGPATGVPDTPIDYRITVANPGTVGLPKVVVTVRFDPALEHALGKDPLVKVVSLDVGALAAGETKTLRTLTLIPRQAGKLVTRVEAKANGLVDQAEHGVVVQRPQMNLEIVGPKAHLVGQTSDWRIQVANPGPVPVTGVKLRYKPPPEMALQSATPPGQLVNGEVLWDLGDLAADGKAAVQLTLRGEQPTAAAKHQADATGTPGVSVAAQAAVKLDGVPALGVKLDDEGTDPVAVGKRVIYRIEVTNTGSLAAPGVIVEGTLPPELALVPNGARGPTEAKVDGQKITFAPLDLPPGKATQYAIEAEGKKPGDVRFRMELRSQSLTQPVVREEATRVYAGGNGPPPAPAPATLPPIPWNNGQAAPLPPGPKN